MVNALSVSWPLAQRVVTDTFVSPDHQSIYIGVPVPRGYRRKRRRRRSSRETSDVDRSRRYSHHRHHEDSHYRDIDVEEGLTDSNEQSLQDINHTGESETQVHLFLLLWSLGCPQDILVSRSWQLVEKMWKVKILRVRSLFLCKLSRLLHQSSFEGSFKLSYYSLCTQREK